MADKSHIEWTDATWNPITGCSVVSPGCTNCYAMKLAGTRLRNHPSRAGLTRDTKAGPVWNGKVRFNAQWLTQPLHWKHSRMIFTCAHGDLFHEDVPDELIDRAFAIMALAPQHTFQVLTKRSVRMREYMANVEREALWMNAVAEALEAHGLMNRCHPILGCREPWLPLPNVWLGVSAEDQQRADERIPHLLSTPAAVRFISAEPLLGPINLRNIKGKIEGMSAHHDHFDALHPCVRERLNWVIAGGESGDGARPMHPDWPRNLRDQCAEDGVAYFFKQWGNWHPEIDRDRDDPDWRQPYGDYKEPYFRILNLAGGKGFHGERVHVMRFCSKKSAGRLLDGVTHDAMPERA